MIRRPLLLVAGCLFGGIRGISGWHGDHPLTTAFTASGKCCRSGIRRCVYRPQFCQRHVQCRRSTRRRDDSEGVALYECRGSSSPPVDATFGSGTFLNTAPFAIDDTSGYKWDVTGLARGMDRMHIRRQLLPKFYFGGLVIVYSAPTLPMASVWVNDGAEALDGSNTSTTSFSGVGSGSGNLWIVTQADDTGNSGEVISFNGSGVGGPIDDNIGQYASLFSIPVTTVSGANTASITTNGDYFGWHLAVLQAGNGAAAVPEPASSAFCLVQRSPVRAC